MSNKPKSVNLPPEVKSNQPRKRKRTKDLDAGANDKISKAESSS